MAKCVTARSVVRPLATAGTGPNPTTAMRTSAGMRLTKAPAAAFAASMGTPCMLPEVSSTRTTSSSSPETRATSALTRSPSSVTTKASSARAPPPGGVTTTDRVG